MKTLCRGCCFSRCGRRRGNGNALTGTTLAWAHKRSHGDEEITDVPLIPEMACRTRGRHRQNTTWELGTSLLLRREDYCWCGGFGVKYS
jgi:hypothetical protein